jgi:hypothetical protein
MEGIMRLRSAALVIAVSLVLGGCYHVTVDTGLTPSSTTIEKPWATSFINGLVPPATVETASKCPTGVAKVDTKLSFLNLLVGGLTIGIFTPMDIRVVCAA